MDEQTAEQFAQRVFDLSLLDARQLDAVWGEFGTRDVPAGHFLNYLVRHELLTNYQVERLRRGERTGFFYGDYKVLYLVGTGSFARVYRAVHKETGKVVAVKVLRKRFSEDPIQKNQFLREGQMGTTLRHPNIVPIYEVHATARAHFLVMDFVEGRNLREFLKVRLKLEPGEATRMILGVTAGLTYAFQHGITHRDLKLSNVLVSSTGQAQLVDFGLAAVDDGVTDISDHPNPRTIDYAALERATGVRKDDPRSDVYFAGCIYYNMLTGQAPVRESSDRLQRLSITRFENVVPVTQLEPELPTPVTMVVQKAMELSPARRYQAPADMHSDLKAVLHQLAAAEADRASAEREGGRAAAEGAARTVMIVESNPSIQDLFRDRLKKCGYRVLVISDPARALDRLNSEPCPADCVVFSAGQLGHGSLEAYNQLGQMAATKHLPAVLLLDRDKGAWQQRVLPGSHRVTLTMPIKFREFRQALNDLFSRTADRPNGDGAS